MIEGKDYILLPKKVVDMLVNKYGGGPMFPRKVFKADGLMGSVESSLFVSLHPTRIEVYHCNKGNKLPEKDQNNFMIRYFDGSVALDHAIKDLQIKFNINEFSAVRCWIKEYGEKVTSIMKTAGSNSVRYLTADLVEWDLDDWKLYPENAYNTGIKEILGSNKDCIEMILETYPSSFTPKDNLWPRSVLLQRWKDYICVGDFIDCQLTAYEEERLSSIINCIGIYNSSWYEGKVVDIVEIQNGTEKKLTVNFIRACSKSYEKDFLVEYTFPYDYDKVYPLHKITPDRKKENQLITETMGDNLLILSSSLKIIEQNNEQLNEVDSEIHPSIKISSENKLRELEMQAIWMHDKLKALETALETSESTRIASEAALETSESARIASEAALETSESARIASAAALKISEAALEVSEIALKVAVEKASRLSLISANVQEQNQYINSKFITFAQCEEEETRLKLALKQLEGKKQALQKVEYEDTLLCVICQERKKVVVLMPCTHLCLCNECSLQPLRQCPLCRATISNRVKVIF